MAATPEPLSSVPGVNLTVSDITHTHYMQQYEIPLLR